MSADKQDEVIIELFSSLKELAELRRKYDSCVSEGYVNMAKARYDIGSRTGGMIGQLQYPREMKSTVVIECEGSGSEQLKFQKQTAETVTSNQPSSQLRQRKKKDVTQNEEGKTNAAMSASEDPKPTDQQQQQHSNATDPIKWFSALPPYSLRQSQGYFKQGLELTLSMANVQLHIEELRKRFAEISKKDLEPETIKPATSD